MAFDPHTNLILFTIAIAPSPASSGTTFYLNDADAANFPDPASGAYNVTIFPSGANPLISNAEIVRLTAKSSANIDGLGHTRFTCTRTQESTSARTILVGDQIMISVTKKTLTDIETLFPTSTVVGISDTQTLTNKNVTNSNIDSTTNVNIQSTTAKARATLAGAQSINNTTWTKVLLDTIKFDPGSNFDATTNHRFTAPVSGYYYISGSVLWGPFSANSDCWTAIYVNGTEYTAIEYGVIPTPLRSGQTISDIVHLNAGDYVELWVYQTSGSSHALANNSVDWNFLSVHLLSLG